ncbi:Methicillin resistance regulatory protein MecI [Aquisphaera giovannonii]|uniref:Methicillin resistance regulatory protein MecI n=1 Tax=Aquisphaera giovannonii TaxID=406548 RepID=A0A5B9W8Z8_9BACT|nr:BlaI/MecI/CopY family transcriptional regulator [Aquisphaera giovannonii]QEH36877.1 Methicillin resistance regulatory protein MecI [Aquisphaera giovannonii]
MPDGEPRITGEEWHVMEVLWDRGPATPAEVIRRVAEEQGWTHRTVRTLLSRLVQKGILRREGDGTRPVYRPAVGRRQSVRELGRSFLQGSFDAGAASLLLHFAREARIGPEELDRLKKLLAQTHGDDEP